jgi:hypothetical protein
MNVVLFFLFVAKLKRTSKKLKSVWSDMRSIHMQTTVHMAARLLRPYARPYSDHSLQRAFSISLFLDCHG